ncbi:hypothetical protein MTX38_28730 [Rhodococcus sp. ARC_M13]|jgi:hypothetical protein|uniref:hypothetical protein n=1 Tax=Rhodococcus TaxID=1827 RepID=UPI00068A2916|nr:MULTISPECIES: hypothetical protein [Rhodococcus]MCJ0901081.1 hypothetical protein [Rhodococcus sp. ARC_M13]QEM25523.1 hypothetical protein D6M20_01430 [Rhodococcus qingshengii]UKO83557.1 hypothetical protein ITJ47_00390 [Rhodococcus erythropolis]
MRHKAAQLLGLRRATITAIVGMTLVATACSTSGQAVSAQPETASASSQPAQQPNRQPTTEALATPGSTCGTVTFPAGTPGTVVVETGAITCTDAVALINRYYNDPVITRQGNTMSAMFDGWMCVSPTAVASQLVGYGSKCENGDLTLVVVTGDGAANATATATPPCTADAIETDLSRDIGGQIRCHVQWAYVVWNLLGDSSSLVRVVAGKWVVYTSFPTTMCPTQARADGVPEAELSSFTHCADDSGGDTDGGSGDLGLSTPITPPTCDGLGIVVVYSATKPGNYATEVGNALAAHPGAKYLRTDHSCPSLRQESKEGNPIYAVYKPAGYTQAEVCAGVHRENDDAYGKWLDMKTDPNIIIAC